MVDNHGFSSSPCKSPRGSGCGTPSEWSKKSYKWWLLTILGFPKMVGFPNNHGVFLLKIIMTWGVKWGETPPFKETPIYLLTGTDPPRQALPGHNTQLGRTGSSWVVVGWTYQAKAKTSPAAKVMWGGEPVVKWVFP